jgi:GABA(A) receptor-associated protein
MVAKNRDDAEKLKRKYPDRIPVIVTRNKHSSTTPDIDKHKYLVPVDLTTGQLLYVIRKRLNLTSDKALFLFVNKSVMNTNTLISSIYEEEQCKEDGFLYVVYSCESVFG